MSAFPCLSIHQMMDIWVASNLLVLLNCAPVAIGIQISFWEPAFNSFESIHRCGLPNHMIFNFLRNHQTFSQQPYHFTFLSTVYVLQFFHILANMLFSLKKYFYSSCPNEVRWYFVVVLICISLMISDVELLFHVLVGHLNIFFGEMSN